MNTDYPSRVRVLFSVLASRTILSPRHQRYVDTLGLKGTEKVLDFGSGSGGIVLYVAKRV
ncbi:MAG: hypothetical protein WCE81_03335 [Halobacteriota archaeon]